MTKIVFRDISIQHAACVIPVYKALQKMKGIRCELQYIKIPRKKRLKEFYDEHDVETFDLLVTASPSVFRMLSVKDQKKTVFMSHGIGGEETVYREFENLKAVFAVGPYWQEKFKSECRKKGYGTPRIHLVGYPKLDPLKHPKRGEAAKKLRKKLELPFKQTVLYTPSLRRLETFDKTVFYLMKIIETVEANLLIKTHCDDEDENHQPAKYVDAMKRAVKMENVKWMGGTYPDTTPLYLISDILVSGASSCLREFMVTGRPSIQISDFNRYIKTKNLASAFQYEGCVQSPLRDVRKNILHALYVPSWMKKERNEQVKKLIYRPNGNATQRAVKLIMKFLGENG